LERDTRIELVLQPWQGCSLPLQQSRTYVNVSISAGSGLPVRTGWFDPTILQEFGDASTGGLMFQIIRSLNLITGHSIRIRRNLSENEISNRFAVYTL
jgi:hypothetical protein